MSMSMLNLRAPSDLAIGDILEQLNILDTRIINAERELAARVATTAEQFDEEDDAHSSQRSFERALAPRISSLENSLVEHINSSIPSLDELVIRQRGRKKQPAKISWSPMKSPFKTPTKCSSFHMSLLSPSPAKNLFNNTSMTLRSSPRKRILADTSTDQDPSTSTPVTTPTKRIRFVDDRPINATNSDVPIRTLLKGLTQDQLIQIICDLSAKESSFEEGVRKNLPLPDIRSFEDVLSSLRKSITRSSPRSRLLLSDGAAFSRASEHLTAFKKTIYNHCKILSESQHFDSLVDYILIAWTYVRGLPIWDEANHNILRKDCFKVLALNARSALRNGGMKLGTDRITNFRNKLKSMTGDYEDIGKCKEALNFLAQN